MDKQNGIYQVAYCDSKFWDETKPLAEQVERTFRWYLIECPLIGFKDIVMARYRARELKDKFGTRAQVIIIGEVKSQFETVTADDILNIATLRGADATECQAQEVVFTKKGKKPVFYSRAEELGYGHFPPMRAHSTLK